MDNDLKRLIAPIKIDQKVVKHLSLGLYRNFALAIKELISNSYDAGASEVKLKLDLEKGRIILRDNGRGISEKEFRDEYLNIGRFKEPSTTVDDMGRMRIGNFGVGFLAPLPYCKIVKIITKKRKENYAIEGEIIAEDFFRKGNWDIKDAVVEYRKYKSDFPLEEGETIIILENIKEQIKNELERTTNVSRSIEGRGYEKFKWTLAQYCPIQFPPGQEELKDFFYIENRIPMKLFLDGEEIYRNVPKGVQILEKGIENFGEIELKYVIMSPNEPVHPEEMRGIQLRLKDVAIGFPRDFDVTKLGRVLGKLNMLCGEINITTGLDNALLVSRQASIVG
ncbi:MAG: ATP-binding protein [Candidatus Cloacimonadales bacterium]|nr:ATP-binding protein [Candidatus Cloacimonadales bacterium]